MPRDQGLLTPRCENSIKILETDCQLSTTLGEEWQILVLEKKKREMVIPYHRNFTHDVKMFIRLYF